MTPAGCARPLELPPYVEYGGRATTPPPFLSEGGRMRGLVLEGDEERIADLVDRMFNVPAGGSTDYRSLGSNVQLLLGGFERVSSPRSPFRPLGIGLGDHGFVLDPGWPAAT